MSDELLKHITMDPAVMLGKPVIKGTRITVEHIMRELANGWTMVDFLDAYPHLTEKDIRAACAYAAATLRDERILIDAD